MNPLTRHIILLLSLILLGTIGLSVYHAQQGVAVFFYIGQLYLFLSPILLVVGMALLLTRKTHHWATAFISVSGIILIVGVLLGNPTMLNQ